MARENLRQYRQMILTSSHWLTLLIVLVSYGLSTATLDTNIQTIETIVRKDSKGFELEEYAFRAPIRGHPEQVLDLYCANIKLRLYWDVFRETVKNDNTRTAAHLRRLARFARHLFKDIRAVDHPFEGEMLSKIDEWFGVKPTEEDQREIDLASLGGQEAEEEEENGLSFTTTSAPIKVRLKETMHKLKKLVKKHAPTVVVGIYTRWATMWWLMMSCLFAKYYLWDPALDEFTKLQKSMVMYPEFQLLKLHEINCLPIKFFEHLLDTCKILNPLMNIDFGQLSLNKMW